jgi:hypothetical protein
MRGFPAEKLGCVVVSTAIILFPLRRLARRALMRRIVSASPLLLKV